MSGTRGRTQGAFAAAPRASEEDGGRVGGADSGDEDEVSKFWAEEGHGPATGARAAAALASGQPDQGDTEEERGGAAMSDAAVRRAASTGVGGEHGAEPEMECGLQGGLSIGQWAAVLSADADGQLQPLRVGVSGTEPCSYGRNEAVVGAGVSGTWAAPGQRGTVCFPGRGGLSQLSKWWVRLEMRPAKPSENGRAWTHAPVAKTAASQPQAHPLTGAVAAVRCRYIGVPLGVLSRSPAAVHSRPSPRPLPTPQWHQRE